MRIEDRDEVIEYVNQTYRGPGMARPDDIQVLVGDVLMDTTLYSVVRLVNNTNKTVKLEIQDDGDYWSVECG